MPINPFPASQLDFEQVIPAVYDDMGRLRVDAEVTANFSGAQEVIISAEDDSIAIGDGTDLVTTTTVGPDVGLDVYVLNSIETTPSGLSGSLKTQSFTVTDTADSIPPISLVGRNSLSVRIFGTATVYIGDSTVTASSGYPKYQNEEVSLDITDNPSIELWGVCDTGQSCEVRILETS